MKTRYYFMASLIMAFIGVVYSAKVTSLSEIFGAAMLIFGMYLCGVCVERMCYEYKKDREIRRIP